MSKKSLLYYGSSLMAAAALAFATPVFAGCGGSVSTETINMEAAVTQSDIYGLANENAGASLASAERLPKVEHSGDVAIWPESGAAGGAMGTSTTEKINQPLPPAGQCGVVAQNASPMASLEGKV